MNKRKIFSIFLIILVLLTSLPLVSANDYYSLKEEKINLDKENLPPPPGQRYGNLIIYAESTYLWVVLLILLDKEPTWLCNFNIINDYDNPITLHKNITLISKRDNKELYTVEFPSIKMEPWTILKLMCLTQYNFQEFGCSFGFIDLVLNVYVEEDNYKASIVFHGFVYGVGVVIFNPNGELL